MKNNFTKRLKTILEKTYSGSNHIGDVYNNEAINQIKQLVAEVVKEAKPEKKETTFRLAKDKPYSEEQLFWLIGDSHENKGFNEALDLFEERIKGEII